MAEQLSQRALALLDLAVRRKSNSKKEKTLDSLWNEIEKVHFSPKDRSNLSSAVDELRNYSEDSISDIGASLIAANAPLCDVMADLRVASSKANERKRHGMVFTSSWLADKVARTCSEHWNRLHRTGKRPNIIADLSCGTGAFLQAVSKHFPDAGNVIGADVDEFSLGLAHLLGWSLHADWQLKCQDTLLSAPHTQGLFPEAEAEEYDILIGNPPYVRSANLPATYSHRLRRHYSSVSKGNFDLSVAFIEHALKTLRPEGIACYILTHKFMTSAYGRRICKLLAQTARVLDVHDFHDSQLFPGYTTYTCVLTFANLPATKKFTVTRFPQGVDGSGDPGPGESESLPTGRLNGHPWEFVSDSTNTVLCKLRAKNHPFLQDTVGTILQGLRTGCNPVFVLDRDKWKTIESELLHPFVTGEHIRRGRADSEQLRLLFPYKPVNGSMEVIPEPTLRSKFPRTWQYLTDNKSQLAERAMPEGAKWYAFSRTQNLSLLTQPKILIREMMPRAEVAADLNGAISFCSGYGLDTQNLTATQTAFWTAVLCTPVMEFAMRHTGTQLQSGWFRLLKHHLTRLRLPSMSDEQLESGELLASHYLANPEDGSALEELNTFVAERFSLTSSEVDHISAVLRDSHCRSLPSANSPKQNTNHSQTGVSTKYEPVKLAQYTTLHRDREDLRRLVTFRENKEAPIHRWYKFTQGFSASLVSSLLTEWQLSTDSCLLDPFLGCGTTLLEARKQGLPAIGIEISPLMAWVSRNKCRVWRASEIERLVSSLDLPDRREGKVIAPPAFHTFLERAYSPHIVDHLWTLSEYFGSDRFKPKEKAFLMMGLLGIMEDVSQIRKHGSHYRYMLSSENAGLQKLNTQIITPDSDIRPILLKCFRQMIEDIRVTRFTRPLAQCDVLIGDARMELLENESISGVITSPPYLNRNNYIAQHKAELAILDLVASDAEYKSLVASTFRSHCEADFSCGVTDPLEEVEIIINAMELSENNNKRIPDMIAGYFDDLNRVLLRLHAAMQDGAQAAFVVGNTRWGGVVVPVDHLILKLAERIGFTPVSVLVTRLKGNSPQQMKRFGRIPVRESIVVIKK